MTRQDRKILVIDDDESIAQIMKVKLPPDRFHISYASTGELGIAALRDRLFDLVLLDLNLPGASGIGVLKYIREDFNQFELPVLIVTASKDPNDALEALSNGANDYISKSLDWKIKLARITTQIELQRLHSDSIKLHELKAINALIVTYNHEINNPLSVAWGGIHKIKRDEEIKNKENLERTMSGMERIRTVVRKIEKVLETQVEYDDYGQHNEMIKIK